MKRLSKLLLMGVVALGVGFTSCNNEDVPGDADAQKGNTHVSVALKLSSNNGAGTRALPNDYNYLGDWAGKDKVETITVYVSDLSEVARYDFVVGTDYEQDGAILRPNESAAIRTTAGLKKVFVLVNGKDDAFTHLGIPANGKGAAAAFEEAYITLPLALENSGTELVNVETSASKLAGVNDDEEDEIMMTTVEPQSINVAPNVLQEETIEDELNRVSIQVERAVARVMVTTANTTYNVPSADGSTSIGSLTNIRWVVAQGENSLFVQRKNNWNTPNFGWIPSGNSDYWDNAGDKYDYSGLYQGHVAAPDYGGTAVPTIADYSTPALVGDASILDGKFVLPTTHAVEAGEASSFKKGNTAYVLVRAQFTPSTFADEGTYTPGDDFFVGANGLFYTTANNAVTPATNGVVGQTVARYVGGKVLYYAWLNPDEIPEWYNSPVLRNNIYHIHITGFRTLGVNWNPLFPEDPDQPYDPNDPDDPNRPKNPDPKPWVDPDCEDCPDEPENPIEPEDPLTTPETWMSVDVTVLPWLVHSYKVDLGI